jgi:hypothetical protein
MSQDATTKDGFFEQLAKLSDEMAAQYGRDFAMGSLVLAARFIAERGGAAEPSKPPENISQPS